MKLSQSCLSNLETQAVIKVLKKGYLGMGEEVKKFEKELSNFFKRSAVCTSSGTSALHLALQAIGITKGDEVLVPTITYIASFQAISASGAKPIACDIDPADLTICLKDAKKKLSKKTKIIMPVHYAGSPGKLDNIYKFAKKNKLRIIEDAAHAFGSIYKKKIGSTGDIVCFSFDGIKNITSGEGGCVVTKDKKIIKKIQTLRLLGIEKETNSKFKGIRNWKFDVKEQGWRYHMSNIMAAIGLQQLKRFNFLSNKRKSLARYYDKKLKKIKYIFCLPSNYKKIVPHIYPVQIKNAKKKKLFVSKLKKEKIEVGFHYRPNHLLSLYKNKNNYFPNASKIYPTMLTLPLHPNMNNKDIDKIVKIAEKII